MLAFFPLDTPITGETAQKDFIRLFGSILRLKNILVAFDDFTENNILSGKTFQDYQSQYLNLHAEFRRKGKPSTTMWFLKSNLSNKLKSMLITS